MATNTYVALKTYTIPSTQATYTFDLTGITGYTDLFIEVAGRTTFQQKSITGCNLIMMAAREVFTQLLAFKVMVHLLHQIELQMQVLDT